MPCTLVLLGIGVHQGYAACSLAGGKTAYYAREEDKHDRTVQHRGIHEIHLGVSAYHHNGQSTGSMRVGEAEHKQGTTLQFLGQETHQIGGNPFG